MSKIDPDIIEISALSIMTKAILNNDEIPPKQKIIEINGAIARAACRIDNLEVLEKERSKIWDSLPAKLKFFALVMAAQRKTAVLNVFRRKK